MYSVEYSKITGHTNLIQIITNDNKLFKNDLKQLSLYYNYNNQ